MARPATRATALAALALSLGSLTACGSGDGPQSGSADVQRAVETEVRAGAVEVVLPAGAASGGDLTVEEGTAPENVPEGVLALGSSARVSLSEGSLDGTMDVAFDPPAELTAGHVPVVMAQDEQGEWQWQPTSWEGGEAPVTAELSSPGQVYLARFDRTPWLAELGKDFAAKANNLSKVEAPTCGDEEALVGDGLQVSSEPGDVLLWCAGVDTIESTAANTGSDVDYATEGVQVPVLRLRNHSRMHHEVGYPAAWLPVDGSGLGLLDGQELRERLGLAGATREGLATRVLAPGDTLSLLITADAAGTVTADLSAAAWTLSSIDFATSTYTRLVSGVDKELGASVRGERERLLDDLLAPGTTTADATTPDATDPGTDSATGAVAECLEPVREVVLMNRDAAQQLVDQAFDCAPELLATAISDQGDGVGTMADGVATDVLEGLPTTLELEPEPWARISDTMTDASAGFQVWVGPPPAQEHDYSDAPHVFRPGDAVDVDEWSTEFTAYVEVRLASFPTDGSCPEGALSVSRYRTDGFALAEEVSCAGEPWRLVLGRVDTGWQEIDDIQQDPHFGCSVLGTYSVPVFIAGELCLDGDQIQEYTG